jgi:hypothetical protein
LELVALERHLVQIDRLTVQIPFLQALLPLAVAVAVRVEAFFPMELLVVLAVAVQEQSLTVLGRPDKDSLVELL